jgi:subtilisin family serine protease
VSGVWTRAPQYRDATGYDGSGVVVGIIDTGIDPFHADFRRADGSTRIAWAIQGGPPNGLHPQLEQAYGCRSPNLSPCAIWRASDIDAGVAAGDATLLPRDVEGHGTHVASIAVGNGDLLSGAQPRFVGVAPGATLIVAAPGDATGFSDPDIVNAARFIFDRATDLGMPAVVNISLGSDFGPHDGNSALSRALAALVGPPGRAIVVAAGNSGALYRFGEHGPFGVHTEAHISPHAVTRVPLMIPAFEGTIDGGAFVWIRFREGDEVDVALEGPGGTSLIGFVERGEESGAKTDTFSATVINDAESESVTIPDASRSAVVAWDGSWEASEPFTILLQGRGDAQLWVTGTRDAAPGLTIGLSFLRALRFGTIGVPAAHPDLIAVGCTVNRVSWLPVGSPSMLALASYGGVDEPKPDGSCYFSAAGPTATGLLKPDLSAPGAFVGAAMAATADPRLVADSMFEQPGCPDPNKPCHVLDESHALTSGTSMSAPHVAGAIALLLQSRPTLTQVELLEILQAGAKYPSGDVPFDYQLGAGQLDVLGAAAVLANSLAASGDIGASYFVLSSPYLRPDPSWHIEGRVALRHADGSVMLASEPPTVHVNGARLSEALQEIRPGMWRFKLSAEHGSGGTSASIEVRYRGASLGKRSLPIGVDGWAAGTGVRAVGGCAVLPGGHAGERSHASFAWMFALCMFAGVRAASRRPTAT